MPDEHHDVIVATAAATGAEQPRLLPTRSSASPSCHSASARTGRAGGTPS
jgi:hypothetical protein